MYKNLFSFFGALLFCLAAQCQEQVAADLQNKFIQYQLHSLQEKIFVHTDKTFYLAGELIWFKLYTVDESFNKPLDLSKVAYVEIISEDQKAVMQAKIALQDGAGNGSLIIPSSIVSGNYKLRSYTSRMKNFSADYFFEQPISIVNTLKPTQVKTPAAAAVTYRIDFFPEGGNLVNKINTTVAFKITDQYGNGIDASGYIVGNKKDTVARIKTIRFGMGSFSWLPQKEITAQAIIKVGDTTIVQSLPQAYDQGYVMHLVDDAADLITVTVSASNQLTNLPVYLFAHTRHLVKEVLTGQTINGKAIFKINKNKLADGVSHITIFNEQKQPVCERLYFKKPSNKLVIDTKTDQPAYASRNKINIGFETKDIAGKTQEADMSVAVFMIDSLQSVKHEDIQYWLMLQSELAGKIESPSFYFDDNNAATAEALNNLMLTQGWRRFKWDDVLQNKLPAFEFVTENEGPVISGVLVDKKTGLPQKNVLTTLTVPGPNFELRSALSKPDGSIVFNVNDFFSNNEIIIQNVNTVDSTIKINITSPFSDRFSAAAFNRFVLPDQWKDQLLYRSVNTQAENAYLIDKKRHAFTEPAIDTNVFYGNAEKQYYLDDYTRFITMEEVMREFVLDVRVRKQTSGYQFRVANTVMRNLFDEDPLVLIDGLPVSNVDKIIAFDPLKIKKIEVVSHRHYLGPLVADGIVSFKTYQGDLGGYELDPSAIVVEYEGLQRQREFFSPVYETQTEKESRIPDLRNLLYWSPSVKTVKDGKQQLSFYTSDLKANFAVVVQGLTADGLAGSSITTFTVNK